MKGKKKTILITGCNGRIGSRLVHSLQRDYIIVGLDNEEDSNSYPFDYYQVDLASDSSMQRCFKKLQEKYSCFEAVIHLAAYYSFSKKNTPLYDEVTIKGTKRILEGLKNIPTEVLIFSSTLLVYKSCQKGEKITEDSPLEPAWAYPKSKMKTERLIEKASPAKTNIFLRIAGCYDMWSQLIPLTQHIRRIYEKHFLAYFFAGDPSHGNPFLCFNDLIDAIILTLQQGPKIPNCTAINLGEPKTVSYAQFQKMISHFLYGKEIPIISLPKWMAKIGSSILLLFPFVKNPFIKPWMIDYADDHYELDLTKAYQLLGFVPKHDIEKDLKIILDNLQKDPKKWYEINHLKYKTRNI